MLKNLFNCVVVVLVIGFNQSLFAQSYPACQSNISDSDGDGYGWENNATCIIDTGLLSPVSFTNLESGQSVRLVRAHWDVVNDFGKDVVCAAYAFDGTQYQRVDDSITGYQFQAASSLPGSSDKVLVTHSARSRSLVYPWAVVNGVYYGPGDLERSRWLEIVEYFEKLAVRIWFLDETYTECSAVNPQDSFFPTGVTPDAGDCVDSDGDGWGWDGVASCRVDGA